MTAKRKVLVCVCVIWLRNDFLKLFFVDYILFSLVGLWTIRVKSSGASSPGAVLRSSAKDMTITIFHYKPTDRKWAGVWMMSWPEEMVLRIWGFWKDVSWDWTIEARVGFWLLKDVVEFFGSQPTEILDMTRCAARWSGVSLVWLVKTFKNRVSLLCTYTSSSSSYRAGSTDIPDPLSPLLPIVHRPR